MSMGNDITTDLGAITFSVYSGGIFNTTPIQTASLGSFLELTKRPTPGLRQLLTDIEQAASAGNKAQKDELKKQLPYFTPAVIGTHRSYEGITSFTGLMPLDFDSSNTIAPRFLKYELFESPYIIASWLSASKQGVHAIAYIPKVNTVDEFKALFWGMYKVWPQVDIAMQKPAQPFYYSADENILIRQEGVKQWTKRGINKNAIKYTPPATYKPIVASNADTKRIEVICQTAIEKITDNGHPQLLRIATALGGYVGAGYVDECQAQELISGMIRSNSYLNTKPKVYERTAHEMIRKGTLKPLYLQ